MIRNSQTHPLRIDAITFDNGAKLGMTFCPGKKQSVGMTGAWDRDLDQDLQTILEWNATSVIGCIEDHEYEMLQTKDIDTKLKERDITFLKFPFIDDTIPTSEQISLWQERFEPAILETLNSGRHVIVFCKGGLGRTGVITSMILTAWGLKPEDSVNLVRQTRDNTICTEEQLQFSLNYHTHNKIYPRPIVTVDLFMLTRNESKQPCLVLQRRKQHPYQTEMSLIGGMIHTQNDENFSSSIQRILASHHITPKSPDYHIGTIHGKHRDPRAWSISSLHALFIDYNIVKNSKTLMAIPLDQLKANLRAQDFAFDHAKLIAEGLRWITEKSRNTLLPALLLEENFSIHDLIETYEKIWGSPLDRANMRRKILSADILNDTKTKMCQRGAPKKLYNLKNPDDALLLNPKGYIL